MVWISLPGDASTSLSVQWRLISKFTQIQHYTKLVHVRLSSIAVQLASINLTGVSFPLLGQTSTPLSVQCRLVYILPYALGLVLLCAYSAAVISFLTVHKTNLPISGLEQLQKDKTYKVGTVQSSSTLISFQV
jgi:hypothetical protein